MATSNTSGTSPRIHSEESARAPVSSEQSRPAGDPGTPAAHDQVRTNPVQADSPSSPDGSGSSPYVKAGEASTGSQSGSLGSAHGSRLSAAGPEQPAAREELHHGERLQVPQTPDLSDRESTPSRHGRVASSPVDGQRLDVPDPQTWMTYAAHNEMLRQRCAEMWTRMEMMQKQMSDQQKQMSEQQRLFVEQQSLHSTVVSDYQNRLNVLALEKAEQHESLMSLEDKVLVVTNQNERMQEEVQTMRRSSAAFSLTGIKLGEDPAADAIIRQLEIGTTVQSAARARAEQVARQVAEQKCPGDPSAAEFAARKAPQALSLIHI